MEVVISYLSNLCGTGGSCKLWSWYQSGCDVTLFLIFTCCIPPEYSSIRNYSVLSCQDLPVTQGPFNCVLNYVVLTTKHFHNSKCVFSLYTCTVAYAKRIMQGFQQNKLKILKVVKSNDENLVNGGEYWLSKIMTFEMVVG